MKISNIRNNDVHIFLIFFETPLEMCIVRLTYVEEIELVEHLAV